MAVSVRNWRTQPFQVLLDAFVQGIPEMAELCNEVCSHVMKPILDGQKPNAIQLETSRQVRRKLSFIELVRQTSGKSITNSNVYELEGDETEQADDSSVEGEQGGSNKGVDESSDEDGEINEILDILT